MWSFLNFLQNKAIIALLAAILLVLLAIVGIAGYFYHEHSVAEAQADAAIRNSPTKIVPYGSDPLNTNANDL